MSETTEMVVAERPPAIEASRSAVAGDKLQIAFFTDLEHALEIDAGRSIRREASQFLAIHDKVLVLVCDRDTVSEGGLILIPDKSQRPPNEGLVIAAGPGKLDANNVFRPTMVRNGDRVLYEQYAGREIHLRGKLCRLMREDEIIGVIR